MLLIFIVTLKAATVLTVGRTFCIKCTKNKRECIQNFNEYELICRKAFNHNKMHVECSLSA